MVQTGCSGAENVGSSKDAGGEDRPITQAEHRSNAAKSVQFGSLIGLSFLRAENQHHEGPASAGLCFLCRACTFLGDRAHHSRGRISPTNSAPSHPRLRHGSLSDRVVAIAAAVGRGSRVTRRSETTEETVLLLAKAKDIERCLRAARYREQARQQHLREPIGALAAPTQVRKVLEIIQKNNGLAGRRQFRRSRPSTSAASRIGGANQNRSRLSRASSPDRPVIDKLEFLRSCANLE